MLIIYLKFTVKSVEGIKKEKKIKLVCDFIGLRNNKLSYNCKKCLKKQLKPINGLIKKFPNMYKFCNGDINEFALY